MQRIYLDNAATTPVSEEVLAAMAPYFTDIFGNPSSLHNEGRAAKQALEKARKTVKELLGGKNGSIIFTSGGTEANNLAVRGAAHAYADKGKRLVTSAFEHSSVLSSYRALEKEGFDVTYVKPDKYGIISVDDVLSAIKEGTTLVSVMYVNNELGTVQRIKEIAKAAHERGALFFTDAVQAAGAIRIDAEDIGADLLSVSGHKINAPKGIGALYVRNGTELRPQITGGMGRGTRAGTENVAFAAGLAKALETAQDRLDRMTKVRELKELLANLITRNINDVRINGSLENSAPGILNVTFSGVSGDLTELLDLYGVSVSSGSACNEGEDKTSEALHSIGLMDDQAKGTVRFSLSKENTEKQIYKTAETVKKAVDNLRG